MGYFLTEAILDPSSFRFQIQKLHEKYRVSGLEFRMEQEGVTFGEIAQDEVSFSKAFARQIKNEAYRLEPAHLKTIVVNGKERLIYRFRITDLILHGVVSKAILDHCMKRFSPNLYSYIKGKNWWMGVSAFAKYVSQAFRNEKDVKKRGLYILRRDISKYTDSIPVGEASPIWPLLEEVLEFPINPSRIDLYVWSLVKGVIRTEAIEENGVARFTQLTGVPTGSPISTTLFNVYMIKLDEEMEKLNPGFYLRYGDDLVVADSSEDRAIMADQLIRKVLHDHWLKSNEQKSESFYFNMAGKGGSKEPFTRGSQTVSFLGAQILANGQVSLGPKKTKSIVSDLNQRISRIANQLDHSRQMSERAKLIVNVINDALDPDSLLCQKSAPLLIHSVTDRNYLKDLDHQICRLLLHWLSGSASVKGFRSIPPKKMRQEWGLKSLYHERNRQGK